MMNELLPGISAAFIFPSNPGRWLRSLILITAMLAGCAANVRDQNALVSAAAMGNADQVARLLGAGENPDVHLKDGTTPLFMAAQQGHTKTVKLLLNAHANPNARGYKRATPLIIAAGEGHKDIVALLIEKGAKVDIARDDKSTALYMAAQSGYINIVRQLLAAGADINKRAYKNATALFIAAQAGHHTIVAELVKKGVDVNVALPDGNTPLIAAALKGYVSVTNILLANGVDIFHRNQRGEDAMQIAKQEGHPELLAILEKAGSQLGQKKVARVETVEKPLAAKQPVTPATTQTVNKLSSQGATQAAVSTPVVAGKTTVVKNAGDQSVTPVPTNAAVKSIQTSPGLQQQSEPAAVMSRAGDSLENKSENNPVPEKQQAEKTRVAAVTGESEKQSVSPPGIKAAAPSRPVAKSATVTGVARQTRSIAELIQQQGTTAVVFTSTGSSGQQKESEDAAANSLVADASLKQQTVALAEAGGQHEWASKPKVQVLARPAETTSVVEESTASSVNQALITATVAETVPAESQPPGSEESEADFEDDDFNNDPSAFGWSAEKFLRSVEELKHVSQDPPPEKTSELSTLNQALTRAQEKSQQPVDGTYLYSIEYKAEDARLKNKKSEKLQTAKNSVRRDTAIPDSGVKIVEAKSSVSMESAGANQSVVDNQYRTALLLIRDREYKKGENAMEAFIARHPDNRLVPSARYWSGVADYSQGRYRQAASKFLEFYKRYPRHKKAPEGLLNLARSLSALKKNPAACTTLKKLEKEYSDALSRLEAAVNTVSRKVCS